MTTTKIEWTDKVWNPVRGCSRVSEGCRNCYAERQAARFAHGPDGPNGVDGSAGYMHGFVERGRWTGRVELVLGKLSEPGRWRKPSRVFVNSMSDLFHEALRDEQIDEVFAAMAMPECDRHTFQVLTKRPERMRDYMRGVPKRWSGQAPLDGTWPPPNVWLGVSVEDRKTANERIPVLRETLAVKRFLSIEPLLEDLGELEHLIRPSTRWHLQMDVSGAIRNGSFKGFQSEDGKPLSPRAAELELKSLQASGAKFIRVGSNCDAFDSQTGCPGHRTPGIDWVIVGGESGPGARPCNVGWISSVVAQCKAAGLACFVKQLGSRPRLGDGEWDGKLPQMHDHFARRGEIALRHPKGGDPSEWSEKLRVREFPR